MCSQPLAWCREGSPQGAPSPTKRGDAHHLQHPEEERYRNERVRLPADKDAKLVSLRGVIDEGESRGWKLISATKDPAADALLVTWDTSGSFSG